ncbi:MAG TPA: FkbM family methyltransferase [Gemmataceae bacterium]|nr:FkbM family methyltransferase [Gemmataceae bacterium]
MNPFPVINRVKQCRDGMMIYNVNDIYIGRSLDLYGEWSKGDMDLFRQILRPGMTGVEIGANIGAHTVTLAQAVWPGGSVLAIEPQRIVFQTLCANLALNNIINVDARQLAVGAAPGTILVPQLDFAKENNFGGLGLGTHQLGEPVSVITLDSLNLARCDFVKIDVEGMEKAVLEGAVDTLARCQPVLYVENDRSEKSTELIRTIDALGYNMYWHLASLYSPDNYLGNKENVFANIASMNMFCMPKGNRNYNLEGFERVAVPPA